MATSREEVRKSIGNALKTWIEAKYGNKAEFARILGVTPQYISNLCNGKTIGKEMAGKMQNHFGLSASFLLTGEGNIETTDQEKKAVFDSTVAKGNRFAKVLDYLVSCNAIENWMDIAKHLNVTESVIKKMINYDPDGEFDSFFLKLCEEYRNISLLWLMTGEGSMLIENEPEQSIDQSSLINAALAAKDGQLAAKDGEIETLNELVKSKNEMIMRLEKEILDKDQVIADLRRTISILQFDQNSDERFKKGVFPIGLAEDGQTKTKV